jgi:heme exporter protein C
MKKLAIGLYAPVVVVLMVWGFYQAIYAAPVDAMQGEIYRVIFYHVPSAMVAFLFFAVSLLGSIGYLAFRRGSPEWAQRSDAWALAGAEVGVVFCTVVLITGPIWGRRAWGMWWTWDARLTTTLVLWLIYVSYLLLRRFAAGPQMQTLAAVLGIFGALDVPIVYMSNRWWRTQHPAPVFGGEQGSGMNPAMVPAFVWNIVAWLLWGILILALRYRVVRKHQKIAAREAQLALEGAPANSIPEAPASASPLIKTFVGLLFVVAAALLGWALYLIGSSPAQPEFDWAQHISQADHDAAIATLNHNFLTAAYAVTWGIQAAYMGWLALKWQSGEARE